MQGNVPTGQSGYGYIAQRVRAYVAAADMTFTRTDLFINHRINPSANITITMPLLEPTDDYSITNAGDGTFSLTIKDSTSAVTISTLATAGAISIFADAILAGAADTTPTT